MPRFIDNIFRDRLGKCLHFSLVIMGDLQWVNSIYLPQLHSVHTAIFDLQERPI